MRQPRPALESSLGLKVLMAVTGLVLFLFVVGHLLGNLQIFQGRAALNDYAAFLKASPGLLWGTRVVLLLALALHVGSAFRLTARSRAARPVAYVRYETVRTTYAARTMLMSGLLLLAYVVYHLLHFTLGVVQPENFRLTETVGDVVRHDVYGMVVAGFSNPWVSLSYIVAQALLAMHLSHGVSSLFQTLGVHHPRLAFLKGWFGPVVAGAIFLGYVSIPIAVLMGVVQ